MKAKALLVLLVALAAAAGGFWGARELERRRCAREKAELEAQQAQALRSMRVEAETWADAIARRQAEAVLRAFVAGIAPSILADRREGLTISSTSLLRVPGIEGIHIVRPEGEILYSSNVKTTTTGELGEGGTWALAAPELVSRPGSRQGSLDLAVPLIDAGQVLAIVWMEYGLDAVRDAGRPGDLAAADARSARPGAPAQEGGAAAPGNRGETPALDPTPAAGEVPPTAEPPAAGGEPDGTEAPISGGDA